MISECGGLRSGFCKRRTRLGGTSLLLVLAWPCRHCNTLSRLQRERRIVKPTVPKLAVLPIVVQHVDLRRNSQLRPVFIFVDGIAVVTSVRVVALFLAVPSRPWDRRLKVRVRNWETGLRTRDHSILEVVLRISQAEDRFGRHGEDGIVHRRALRLGASIFGPDLRNGNVSGPGSESVLSNDGCLRVRIRCRHRSVLSPRIGLQYCARLVICQVRDRCRGAHVSGDRCRWRKVNQLYTPSINCAQPASTERRLERCSAARHALVHARRCPRCGSRLRGA